MHYSSTLYTFQALLFNFINVCVHEQKYRGDSVSFYDRFIHLCEQKGVKPSRAAEDCGINRSNVSMWKNNGSTPRGGALQKISEYFGVTTDYLLGNTEQKESPVLSEKDRRDIARDLELMMAQLDADNDLMFDGDPISDEAKASIRSALQMGLEIAKVKNKERFTPKKYRKD